MQGSLNCGRENNGFRGLRKCGTSGARAFAKGQTKAQASREARVPSPGNFCGRTKRIFPLAANAPKSRIARFLARGVSRLPFREHLVPMPRPSLMGILKIFIIPSTAVKITANPTGPSQFSGRKHGRIKRGNTFRRAMRKKRDPPRFRHSRYGNARYFFPAFFAARRNSRTSFSGRTSTGRTTHPFSS